MRRFSTVFGAYGAKSGYLEKKWLFMAQKVAIYGAIGGYYGAIGGYLALQVVDIQIIAEPLNNA